MKAVFTFLTTVLMLNFLTGQHRHGRLDPLKYPDIEGYKTLSTDLHQHTVFSDGNVWPTIRVQEAIREGLDAISLTEHLEYQPHKDDIPHPDRNRAYLLAVKEAKDKGLLIIHGSEITRSAPIGHSNAVFISDANALMQEEAAASFSEAKKQNAFIFWNHPAWYAQSPKGTPILSDFQKERIKKGELHGIEVINSFDYAEESLSIALEQNLTILGTSDIHGLIEWDYIEKGHHRPITLVFAEEKSLESIQKALFAGRTVAVYNSLMIGKPEYLEPLLQKCLNVTEASYIENTQILKVVLENVSSSDLLFENQMPYTFYSSSPVFSIPAGGNYTLQIKTLEQKEEITLALKALKAYTAPKVQPVIRWTIPVE
ncbi:Sb-PDE family phosphodiesterase [Poritiphilus flavus]|uniref:PHP domain-containing protein n=1 Tax=Poritiphilus flavus TaxID=2697053 RepID=A0A6L9E8K8_9FLAO|nr:Sb-PDE family phosphodiesterase [Poritiphilus flavus]NAS11056.1 PHP domain-containing protein [Poritiphilus flavus]